MYPITHPDRKCRFCGEYFEEGFCLTCGKYTKLHSYNGRCDECFTKVNTAYARVYLDKLHAINEARLHAWLSAIDSIPTKTLTEQEWLETCTHFGKCAYCANEHIDARAFFIAHAIGGKYTVWNIIPVCEQCALKHREAANPFISLKKEILEPIVEYLSSRIEEAKQNAK